MFNKMLEKYLPDVGENWNSLRVENLFELPVIRTKRTFIISFKMFSYDIFSMILYLFIPRYTLTLH